MNQPFFSIVVPTKDRPECVSILLESIKNQSYRDYEVIVSDNAFEKPCRNVVEAIGDSRFLYFRTEKLLGMCDSYEAAISHAHGKWIMMFGDKNILYPDALEKLYKVVQKENPEVINFSQDYLSPNDVEKELVCGKLRKVKKTGTYCRVDLQEALEAHMSCNYMMAGSDKHWYLGSIFYGGGYKESFVKKIRLMHESGRVFNGIVPDRYGAVETLCIAEDVLWLDDNICIYNLCGKNTWSGTLKKGYDSLCAFVRQSREGKDYFDKLLIPGVVASVYNVIASDYYNAVNDMILSKRYRRDKVSIDRERLVALVEEELLNVKNISDDVLDSQKKLLSVYVRQFDKAERNRLEEFRSEYRNQKKRGKRLHTVKAGIDKILCKGMNSALKPVSIISMALEKSLSKDVVLVKGLSEIK